MTTTTTDRAQPWASKLLRLLANFARRPIDAMDDARRPAESALRRRRAQHQRNAVALTTAQSAGGEPSRASAGAQTANLFLGVQQPIAAPQATHVDTLMVYCGYHEFRSGQEPQSRRVITHSQVITLADFEIRDRTPVAGRGTDPGGHGAPEPMDTEAQEAVDTAPPLSEDRAR